MIVYANLDQEARWSGLGVPAHVARRISAASALLAALAEPPVEIWAPAAVDPARVRLEPAPVMKVGVPPRWDLAWCDPAARHVNDRRFALAPCGALPGTRVLEHARDLDGEWPRAWVAKAAWTAAGRDRAHGEGAPAGELRARVANLVAKCPVIVEPWCERVVDVGVCSVVGAEPRPPHRLLVDARGRFVGIDRRAPELAAEHRARLAEIVAACDAALARAGYAGPFTVDAFVHAGGLHACELNARYTFGHVAHALGVDVLGFGPAPAGARVLIAPDADFTAWAA